MKYIISILCISILFFYSIEIIAAPNGELNSVCLGFGIGQNLNIASTEFSLLAGYDRHVSGTPEFTFGLLAEGVFGNHSYFLLGVPIGFYPVEKLKLWLAPCYSLSGGGKTYYTVDDIEYMKPESEFILKFGLGYNYHFQNSRIAMLPFIEGNVIGSDFILGAGVKFNFYFSDGN